MRATIFANGVIENAERAREAADKADLVLAANGGALHCLHLELVPAFVVGDLDSLDEADRQTLEASGTEFISHPPDKDQTDLELALLDALARGATEITVLGLAAGCSTGRAVGLHSSLPDRDSSGGLGHSQFAAAGDWVDVGCDHDWPGDRDDTGNCHRSRY